MAAPFSTTRKRMTSSTASSRAGRDHHRSAASGFGSGSGSGSACGDASECELEELLSRSLARIGVVDDEDDRNRREASRIARGLSDLYVYSVDQLRSAFDDPDLLQMIWRDTIRGALLPAVRAELKRIHEVDNQSRSSSSSSSSSRRRAEEEEEPQPNDKPLPPMNKPLKRRLEVARVDLTQLSAIDQISQTFHARILLILRIRDGASDPDLTKSYDGFPLDDAGRPTFRPSARWYLNQIDFPNGTNIRVMESKVTTEKSDLHLVKRVEGEFFERFELQNFPFDAQDLTVTVSANCANEGPVPVEFVDVRERRSSVSSNANKNAAPQSLLGVDTVNFTFDDIWNLSPTIAPEITTIGASGQRRFPAVHLRACVSRRPSFILLNVAMPTSVIAFLSLMTFFVIPEDTGQRLELSIAILLTSVAFKYATAAHLPHISYLTLVDVFVLLCMGIIVLVNICHGALGLLENWVEAGPELLDVANKCGCAIIATAWLFVQLWFWYRARLARESDTEAGQKRAEDVRRARRARRRRRQHRKQRDSKLRLNGQEQEDSGKTFGTGSDSPLIGGSGDDDDHDDREDPATRDITARTCNETGRNEVIVAGRVMSTGQASRKRSFIQRAYHRKASDGRRGSDEESTGLHTYSTRSIDNPMTTFGGSKMMLMT